MWDKLKLKKRELLSFLILIIFGLSMLHISLSIVLVLTTLFMIITGNYCKRYVHSAIEIRNMKKRSIISLFIITIFVILQSLILGLNFSQLVQNICINSAIFIFLIINSTFIDAFNIDDIFFKGLCLFYIFFSTYYLYKVVRYGLPSDRDSVLGFVSSNYCSAILYLGYPLILYQLFSERNRKRKTNHKLIYFTLFESLIVILLSGSRTAFAVVLFIFLSLLFVHQNTIKDSLKTLCIIVSLGLIIFIVYENVPELKELLDRAMIALQGSNALKDDVRVIAWQAAFDNFQKYNQFIGSGSNMVYQFGRPAHNFFIEILLTDGFIGIILFAYMYISNFFKLFIRASYIKKFFLLQLTIATIIVAYVQPFFSTSFTIGIIVWGSFLTICFKNGGEHI